jgi:hypothetical protein
VIQLPHLAIEHVCVCVLPEISGHQVGVIVGRAGDVIGTGDGRNDRIFLGVGIQVADDQNVGVIAAGGIGGQPVDQRLCREREDRLDVRLEPAESRSTTG